MPLILNAYTTTANTTIIADTGAPPGSLPTPAVVVTKAPEMPFIDGNGTYIFSPFDGPGATVTLESVFEIGPGLLPIFTVGLPITVNFAYAANLTATSSAVLEAVNLLGIVVLTVPLFTGVTNGGNNQNVAIGSGDALLLATLLPTLETMTITVTTTVTAPEVVPYPFESDGSYLGNLRVQALAVL
ncbi:hypothetical protein PAESOLCIP111_02553 [Paenibacillus solanacearum]|uniref:Uncharacterized protein n=1 Tax=Paenibacillus solanacearum TaxID=2048548 RepID=A0A916K185_9BACL|nr:hypothetical protein [Paenibacillus solanacearum]CAG7623707.1 hypothetical protein PAESOLCIP111_02553 [Paenibacillus solanacearum]